MPRLFRATFLLLAFASLVFASGCAHGHLHPAGKVALTPLTGVRDIVDAPLVSLTNVFQFWADKSNPTPTPGANVGWTLKGGFNAGIGISVAYYLFQGVSWAIGGVDYVICRSVWPNFPKGVSPWRKEGEPWGSLYFPNTKALWDDDDEEVQEDFSGGSDWNPPPPNRNPEYPYNDTN